MPQSSNGNDEIHLKVSHKYACYGWIITEDYVSEGPKDYRYQNPRPSDVGLTGPRNIDPEIEKLLKKKQGQSLRQPDQFVDPSGVNKEYGTMDKFKMLDDDGNLYYVGWIAGIYDLSEPLRDFGTPNAGAVLLKYLEKDGSWSSNTVEGF